VTVNFFDTNQNVSCGREPYEVYCEYGLLRVQPVEMQSRADILVELANP
jgi:hypothetical protein